ncbi:MAG: nuclear transport factor 2 family protein [Candidatus Limnocylindria bacterium]
MSGGRPTPDQSERPGAPPVSDPTQAAREWAATWRAAWPAHDVDAIVALYADDAVYLSHPFREPLRGRDGARQYVTAAFAEEEAVECWFAEPIASGDGAAVEYRAVLRTEGREMSLAGVSVLRFDPMGLVVEHRDYWAMTDGRRLEV